MPSLRLLLSLSALSLFPLTLAAQVRTEDREAVESCLRSATDNRETCIGVIYKPCTETPEGGNTRGMGECAARETAAWTELMETSLAALTAGSLGQTDAQPYNRPNENRRDVPVKGAEILADMQRTFFVWRAKKCDTLAMQAEGGSFSRILYGTCTYEETARHALWLKALAEDIGSR
jgi:uncharacterized protein YecT (DUF1311 family)